MVEINPTPSPKKKKFLRVTESPKVAGGANRDDPSVTIHPSGYAVANRGGTEIMDQVAGTADSNYLVTFGAHPETKSVAVYAGNSSDLGLVRVRRYQSKGGSRIAFHLGGVWRKHPSLRPDSKGDYAVKYDTDEDGVAIMEIALGAPLGKRKGNSDPVVETQKSAASEN